MTDDIYALFAEVCNRHHIRSFVREYAFGIYMQKVVTAIKNEESLTNATISSQQKEKIAHTLANEEFILEYARTAEANYKKEKEIDFQPYFKENAGAGFWKSVAASVLANFLYSLLLILMFYVAKDQIGVWLQQLSVNAQ